MSKGAKLIAPFLIDKIHLQFKINKMKIIISEIENTENKTKEINFSEIYEEFNKEVPVKAKLKAEVLGDLIRITGEIKAEIILTCDICLKEFKKEFNIKVEEFFTKYSLNEKNIDEFEIKQDSFIEDLNGKDEIDITDFVYQSVILNIPNKCVCDINCKGDEKINQYIRTEITDPRLEIFKKIKIEKDN